MSKLPDFCKLTIHPVDCFIFLIPVSAFGIDDEMIMEVSVEYMKSDDGLQYHANIWCREKGAYSRHFLYPVSVPDCSDPETAIVQALNDDETFDAIMRDYICEAAKHRHDID